MGRIEDRDRLLGWVYRIARNMIIDEYRRAARERSRLSRSPTTPLRKPAMTGVEIEPSALTELAACMRPLLDGLSPERRRARVVLRVDGMTQADAAVRRESPCPG